MDLILIIIILVLLFGGGFGYHRWGYGGGIGIGGILLIVSEIGDRYATHGKIIRDVPGNGRLIKHALATAATQADEKPWTARFCFGYCVWDCTGLPSLSAPLGSFACTLAVWARRSRCMRWSAWGARPL